MMPLPTKIRRDFCLSSLQIPDISLESNALSWSAELKDSIGISGICSVGGSLMSGYKYQQPEYRSWTNMKLRTTNPGHEGYPNYGGRGIRVCDEWLGKAGFWNFLSHVGPRPTPQHTIDRYPNNDGNYEPGNVRWATRKEQANNRRVSSEPSDPVTLNGRSLSIREWAKETGINFKTLWKRLHYLGWAPEKALLTPARAKRDASRTPPGGDP